MRLRLFYWLLLAAGLGACRKEAPPSCAAGRALYQQYPFPVGAALAPELLDRDADYQALAVGQFNSVTPENIFKPEYLHPEPTRYDWAAADRLAAFCRAHGQRLHGHCLLWHQQLPGWLYTFSGSAADWDELLRDHVQTICRHFRGQVSAWDVVNEAFAADGTLRPTIWLQHLGAGYLEKAYRYAHEADPDARLFYNDYDLESNLVKRRAVLAWLRTMQQRGVPVQGLGLQLHISIQHPLDADLATALAEVQQSGLLLHFSEVDVSLNPLSHYPFTATPALLQRQADRLNWLFHLYQQLPPAQQYGITFWGVCDRYTWIRSYFHRDDYPLLFDSDYQPKPAYCTLAYP